MTEDEMAERIKAMRDIAFKQPYDDPAIVLAAAQALEDGDGQKAMRLMAALK